jgi:hypothetical protein
MKGQFSSAIIPIALLLLWGIIITPAFGFVAPEGSAAVTGTPVATSITDKSMISATVSAATPAVGDPVTISGAVTGGKPVTSVRMWVFAGSYVDVSAVPVNADGTYSKTFQTAGFPQATYYIFIQSPGNSGTFDIELEDAGKYSGQVVNTKDGSLLLNFTGTGSVQNADASVALSEALIRSNSDDIYTKTTFQLIAPSATTPALSLTTPVPAQPRATTKSPISLFTILAGLGICGFAFVLRSRK